ncbi:MAG: hypothetical protein HRT94_03510 [Alphaproteobacteria bacterium]|nr:hypothetical protein [Alphaproteobacteria bacterium]
MLTRAYERVADFQTLLSYNHIGDPRKTVRAVSRQIAYTAPADDELEGLHNELRNALAKCGRRFDNHQAGLTEVASLALKEFEAASGRKDGWLAHSETVETLFTTLAPFIKQDDSVSQLILAR